MLCQRCQSERVALLFGNCADRSHFEVPEATALIEHDGYPPTLDGLTTYKGIRIEVCLDCGQVQGTFPIAPKTVRGACGFPAPGDDDE